MSRRRQRPRLGSTRRAVPLGVPRPRRTLATARATAAVAMRAPAAAAKGGGCRCASLLRLATTPAAPAPPLLLGRSTLHAPGSRSSPMGSALRFRSATCPRTTLFCSRGEPYSSPRKVAGQEWQRPTPAAWRRSMCSLRLRRLRGGCCGGVPGRCCRGCRPAAGGGCCDGGLPPSAARPQHNDDDDPPPVAAGAAALVLSLLLLLVASSRITRGSRHHHPPCRGRRKVIIIDAVLCVAVVVVIDGRSCQRGDDSPSSSSGRCALVLQRRAYGRREDEPPPHLLPHLPELGDAGKPLLLRPLRLLRQRPAGSRL